MNNISITITGFMLACLAWTSPTLAQDYKNSIASTDFDFIHESDPSAFERLEFTGKRVCEMPDKRFGNQPLRQPAFVFVAAFSDGTRVQLAIDSAFKTKEAARTEAMRYVAGLGKLPTTLRKGVQRLVVHKGGRETTAFSDVGLIVVYSENATKRISNHDLEETIFHESVHAAWDKQHASSEAWRRAQAQDGGFVTMYAKQNPDGEDLAESALFAYMLTHHPERIPASEAKEIRKAIPARIRFVAALIPPDQPIFYNVANKPTDAKASDISDKKGEPNDSPNRPTQCQIDISSPGQLGDIISNALTIKFDRNEKDVNRFLAEAQKQATGGEELFQLTVVEFKLDSATFKTAIMEFMHCNCTHRNDPTSDKRTKQMLDAWTAANK